MLRHFIIKHGIRASPCNRIRHFPLKIARKTPIHSRRFSVAAATSAGLYTSAGGKTYNGLGYLFFSLAGTFSAYWWRKDSTRLQDFETFEPPPEFIHPITQTSSFYKLWLYVSRHIFLFVLFIPVTSLFLLTSITQSDYLYQKSLDLLELTIRYAGCGFQKFAQWMSMRPDKFHEDLIEVASRFRENAPLHSLEHSRAMFRKSFGKELHDVFEFFDPEPIASGTIAQVHKARLRKEFVASEDNNRDVAVKIQHPHCLAQSYTDPRIMMNFCDASFALLAACLPIERQEFSDILSNQIDFKREAYNMQRFQRNFKDADNVTFPEIHPEFCSDTIIVESFETGLPVGEMMSSFDDAYGYKYEGKGRSKYSEEFRKKLAQNIFDFSMDMYLRHNFAHADLHSGNLLAKEDASIVVLDTGMVTSLQSEDIDVFFDFLEAGCRKDACSFTEKLMYFDAKKDTTMTQEEITGIIQSAMDRYSTGDSLEFGSFYGNLLQICDNNGLKLRGDVATSVINMGVIEGMIRSLDSDFNVGKSALPHFLGRKQRQMKKWDLKSFRSSC